MNKTEEHILVIFGASGDLTRRKLIPAVYRLYSNGLLPEKFAVLGIGRTSYDHQSFRAYISEALELFISDFGKNDHGFLDLLYYHSMDPSKSEGYTDLGQSLQAIAEQKQIKPNYIFYLATPPRMYETIPSYLHKSGLTNEVNGWKRIIIEKPFGTDIHSARELNTSLKSILKEEQIYRIDHYLGKETVQNILVTRFSNGIFEPLWNRNYVDHIEITSAENIGVGSRGGYYDHSGALRDMLQNHLLQLVALVAMEPPSTINSETIRNEMLKVFQSFRPLEVDKLEDSVIRGQYMESHVRGEFMQSYRSEEGVPDSSRTETYVALKLYVDNWRWGGVPFYIRTGKRLPTKVTEIVIHFKPSPQTLFCQGTDGYESANKLVLRIQPDEGILLKFGMKVQGAGYNVRETNMDFHYSDLADASIPEAYERLLLDCMQGDSTLYARGDAVEEAWKFVDPILKKWHEDSDFPLHGYPCGTWGPELADRLIENENQTWRYPCKNLADDGNYCEL